MDDAARLEFIQPFGTLGVKFGNMLPFVKPPSSWSSISWESFADGADTIITHKLMEKVVNPVAKVVVEYMSAIRAVGGAPAKLVRPCLQAGPCSPVRRAALGLQGQW